MGGSHVCHSPGVGVAVQSESLLASEEQMIDRRKMKMYRSRDNSSKVCVLGMTASMGAKIEVRQNGVTHVLSRPC